MKSRQSILIIVVLAVIVVAGVTIVRTVWRPIDDPVDEVFERTRSPIALLPMQTLTARSDVEVALESIEIEGEVTAAQRESLIRLIVDAIDFYHVHEDANAYLSWQSSSGATLKSLEEMRGPGVWDLDSSIRYVEDDHADQGFEVQSGSDSRTYYQSLWTVRQKFDAGAHRIAAMAVSPAGLHAVVRRDTRSLGSQEWFSGTLGSEAWFGGVTSGARRWHDDPRVDQLRSEAALGAHVGVMCEFGDGMRRPVHFLAVWDPQVSRWRLENVVMANRPRKYMVWPWEL